MDVNTVFAKTLNIFFVCKWSTFSAYRYYFSAVGSSFFMLMGFIIFTNVSSNAISNINFKILMYLVLN